MSVYRYTAFVCWWCALSIVRAYIRVNVYKYVCNDTQYMYVCTIM